jgi:hypothetical protein
VLNESDIQYGEFYVKQNYFNPNTPQNRSLKGWFRKRGPNSYSASSVHRTHRLNKTFHYEPSNDKPKSIPMKFC